MKDKIEIGDTVEVTSCGSMYEAYERMARFLGSTRFVRGKHPSSMVFTVANIGIHHAQRWDVYLLSNESGEFLFDNDSGSIKVINKAKPTRTEYVKVDESIFDLKAEFEAGELYMPLNAGSFELIAEEVKLCELLCYGLVYRKVEREVTWQDELSEYVKSKGLSYSCNGAGHIRAVTWEGDDDLKEMCHKVYHLTK